MASFISTLSLLILVLANGYFTLPVVDRPLSSSTFSSLHDGLTTERARNLRLVKDDASTESFTSEPSTFITEESHTDKSGEIDVLSTTSHNTESETGKREIQVESTTNNMLSFSSTSSSVAPQLYTSEPSTSTSTSTSTKKYTGLLQDDKEIEKPIKTLRKGTLKPKESDEDSKELSTKKSKFQSKDKSDEDSKESPARTAVFDQDSLKKFSNVPNDVMMLDESNDLVVTGLPNKLSTTTKENTKEQKPLNQGEESSHIEEKKSDN